MRPGEARITAPVASEGQPVGLRSKVLSEVETLAQAVAGVAPSAMPAMTISIVFGMCGYGAWFVYVLATIAVIFTAYNINVFAQRSATSGSLYSYATLGLGKFCGMLSGWALLSAYCLCITASSTQFAIFAKASLSSLAGIQLHSLPLIIGCIVAGAAIAYKNIKLSAEMMLWLEIASMAIIIILCTMALHLGGGPIDFVQLKLTGMTADGFRLAFVLAMFAVCGFETAATLGVEADGALKSVPRALFCSALICGVFFIFSCYSVVHGFSDCSEPLAKAETPLLTLSRRLGAPLLGQLTVVGAALSFFACCLATVNAAARMLFTMAREHPFPAIFGRAHPSNQTPHIAIFTVAGIGLLPAVVLLVANQQVLDVVGWAGTTATYGFVFAYVAVSVAAPIYLHRLGLLTIKDILLSAASCLLMGGSFVLSLYPAPAPPYCWLQYIFLAYMVVGAVWYFTRRARSTL